MFYRTSALLIIFSLLTISHSHCQVRSEGNSPDMASLDQNFRNTKATGPDYVWEYYQVSESFNQSPLCQNLTDPVFGVNIACLRTHVDDRYNEKEQPVPGDPTVRTHLVKPDIYKAVRNIGKYYKKEVSKQGQDQDRLKSDYEYILRVALAVLFAQHTDSFEKALREQRKNTVNQIALFKKVKLL